MTKYYFTMDFDGTIAENADIEFVEADSATEAEQAIITEMKECFPTLEDDELKLGLTVGDFGDCWFKCYGDIEYVKEHGIDCFKGSELLIGGPGTHPGGNCYWINPAPDVYVPSLKSIED